MEKCKPRHDWNTLGQCRKCSRWKKGTVERYLSDFWRKVQRGPACWEWQAKLDVDGYAAYSIRGTTVKASRMMWMIQNGEVPIDKEICHACDNRKCVNPGHLFLGTHQQNMDDMMRKKGNASAKLTVREVSSIEIHHALGHTMKDLAVKFKVTPQTISRIVNGKTWKIRPQTRFGMICE